MLHVPLVRCAGASRSWRLLRGCCCCRNSVRTAAIWGRCPSLLRLGPRRQLMRGIDKHEIGQPTKPAAQRVRSPLQQRGEERGSQVKDHWGPGLGGTGEAACTCTAWCSSALASKLRADWRKPCRHRMRRGRRSASTAAHCSMLHSPARSAGGAARRNRLRSPICAGATATLQAHGRVWRRRRRRRRRRRGGSDHTSRPICDCVVLRAAITHERTCR